MTAKAGVSVDKLRIPRCILPSSVGQGLRIFKDEQSALAPTLASRGGECTVGPFHGRGGPFFVLTLSPVWGKFLILEFKKDLACETASCVCDFALFQ